MFQCTEGAPNELVVVEDFGTGCKVTACVDGKECVAAGVESLNVWLVTASNWRSTPCLSLEIETDNWAGLNEPKCE